MIDPITAISVSLEALQKAYNTYQKVTNLIKQWQMSEKDLEKLWIQFEIGYAQASYNLEQLAKVPDHDENTSIAARTREVELRQACVDVLKDQMLEAAATMEKLFSQLHADMSKVEKAKWLISSRESLGKTVKELRTWAGEAKQVCEIKVNYLYNPIPHVDLNLTPSLPIDALAQLVVVRRDASSPSTTDDIWIQSSSITFEDKDEAQQRSRDFLSLLRAFRKQAKYVKVLPRRFGILNRSPGPAEQIMVEFMPYTENLFAKHPGDYKKTEAHARELARMLHSATDHTTTVELPLVPFLGLSELRDTSPPCFLLVYRGDNLETLYSVINTCYQSGASRPSVSARLRLAVTLAKAIFSLHRAAYVHGGLSTDTLFLPIDREGEALMPLIAGFEIARPADGSTEKLDSDNKDRSLYIHPNRILEGNLKDSNFPPYDICSLGIILLEIGLWTPLRHQKGMVGKSDGSRRKTIYGTTSSLLSEMGLEYMNAVKYCLQGYIEGASAPAGSVATEKRNESFGNPNAAELIALLEPLLANHP